MIKKLSWTPRARGKVYCSPACGWGCTRGAYERARRESKTLAKKLGPGWKARVWDNLGWHYAVACGTSAVHPYGDGKGYWVSVFAGSQFTADHKDPRKALAKALRNVDREIKLMISERKKLTLSGV